MDNVDYSLGGGSISTEYSLDNLLNWKPDYSVSQLGYIAPDNRGFAPTDTSGLSWGSWLQNLAGSYLNYRAQKDMAQTKTAQTTSTGTEGQQQPAPAPSIDATQIGVILGVSVLGVFLIAKLVK